jgi:two-component sensor histidine kinase
MILNELVQNAVEHGFQERDRGFIEVRIGRTDEEVVVEIVNDGDPLPPDFDPRQSPSLGLQIVSSLTQNDLGGRFSLTAHSGPGDPLAGPAAGDLTKAAVTFPV